MLVSLIKKGRMPHAFLLSGPDGIGKKLIVQEFAKYLFCKDGTACGACRQCVKVDRGIHPDIMQVGKEDVASIGIEQSRVINREVYEHPFESQKRIIIIDNSENMTHEAKNALLKTLEEPPLFNIFFLITSSERDIPLTIRSRCIRIVFGPLHRRCLKEHFQNTFSFSEEKADLLSCISHGSIGNGLFWAAEENFILRRKIAELILGKNNSSLRASVIAEKLSESQREMDMYLSFILSLYRDIYYVNECGSESMVINKDMKEFIVRRRADANWLRTSIQNIEKTMGLLRYNVNKWLVFENLMLRLMESQ